MMPPGDESREASAVLVTDEATSKCQYPGNLCCTVQKNRNAIGKFTVIGWPRFFFERGNKKKSSNVLERTGILGVFLFLEIVGSSVCKM